MGNILVLWRGGVYLIGPNFKLTWVQYWKPSMGCIVQCELAHRCCMEPKPLLNKILCASNGSRNKMPWVQIFQAMLLSQRMKNSQPRSL